jgi:hypothetical protein
MINRSQENAQMQEQGVNQWEKEARIVKTSEDQYERSHSSSSKSSADEEKVSPKSNAHNAPSIPHYQGVKPDFNRVFILSIGITRKHLVILVDLSPSKSSIIN